MSDLKVCRICLCQSVKMYNFDSFDLKQYYEEIMTKKMNLTDGLPRYFCYECAAILYKFHKFKEKCCTGEKALQQLLWSGSVTLSSISEIDREAKNLQSPINIISVNKRVRTFIIKSTTLSKTLQNDIKKVKIPEIQECKLKNDSDNSMDDKNLAEIKNEIINVSKDLNEDVNTNLWFETSTEEKVIPDLVDNDSVFNDDEDSWPTYDEDKPPIKKEISNKMIDEEEINLNTEQTETNDDIVPSKNDKVKKRKKTKVNDFVDKKVKKFEVSNTKKNYLDPNHWLKINLTEEQALEEFKARAQDRKYVRAAYQCSDCLKGFSKEDMLNRHIKLNHSESLGPVVCRFCSMRFKLKCYLTQHIIQHYTKYKCLRCDLICPLKTTALFHNEYHNGVVRKCIHCGEEFRHLSTYYTHLRTHRSEHVCTLCGASFVSTMGLNMHKRTMHIDTVVNHEEVNTYCDRCDIRFETKKAYEEHVFHSAKHAEGIQDLAIETPAPSKPKKTTKNLRRKPRKFTSCTICNRNFSTLTAYMKHHTAEHKDEPLPSKKEQRHILCEICGALLGANSVGSHLNTHTREKLYTCSTCRMQFNSKGSMTRHQLTHTNEKPVACTLCDKRFKQVSNMKLHYRTYHLKEPYPKRNRKKKNDELSKDGYGHEDSDDNMTLDNFYGRKY